MTDRLADITARIADIRQLGAVVNAMRGIAGARAQQARGQLLAVDSYAGQIAAAIGRVLAVMPARSTPPADDRAGLGLVVFCAEQGFAGAFSERVLDAVGSDLGTARLYLIGTRGLSIAAERGITPLWSGFMPSHSPGIPKLADRVAEALNKEIAAGRVGRLDAVFASWQPGQGMQVERRRLLPLDEAAFPPGIERNRPLLNLPATTVFAQLAAEYVHAELCQAALHAFAAENEARTAAMAAARREIERQLGELQGEQRIVRQDEITAEIIELASGEAASRAKRRR